MSYKNSGSCPRKAQARLDTIINPYQELFHKSIPINRQYWTLAGPCYDENGKLGTHSEIWQLTASGLIFTKQYCGVDNGLKIIEKNRIAAPTAKFIHGDFVKSMFIAAEDGTFQPSIIHADFTHLAKTSIVDTSNIIYLVDKLDLSDIMITCNFPYNNPYAGKLTEEIDHTWILKLFENNQRFNSSWNEKWSIYPKYYPKYYTYGGTGKNSNTTMITFIFIKH